MVYSSCLCYIFKTLRAIEKKHNFIKILCQFLETLDQIHNNYLTQGIYYKEVNKKIREKLLYPQIYKPHYT